MTIVYVVLTTMTAAANAYAAFLDFRGNPQIIATMQRKRLPRSWLMPLGGLKGAGAVGLVVGFAIPMIGTAAAIGLVLFFVGAVGAHLRVRYYRLTNAAAFLALAVAALAANLAYHGQ